jgi:spore maturation protein CgeB
MKIFFSGYHNPKFLTVTEYLERAITKLGHELFVCEDRCHIVPGRLRKKVALLYDFDLWHINRRIRSCIKRSGPAIAIISGGHRITTSTIEKINGFGIVSVLWTIDPPWDFHLIINAAPFYTYVFCQGTEAVDILKENGIPGAQWMPMACDPEIHKPVPLSEKEKKKYGSDIVFVGSYYKNRADLLRSIVDFDLGIWGPGWERLEKDDPLRKCVKGGSVVPEEFNKIYSAAKINIIGHYQDGKNPCYQVSPKVFEALAACCFVLVDRQKDVFSLFRDKEHLVGFDGVDDLRKKLVYYLEHSDERGAVADRGYHCVLENHTYVHRIKKVLSAVTGSEKC